MQQSADDSPNRARAQFDPLAANGLASSNTTSNHFLGVPQRSWMSGSFTLPLGRTVRPQNVSNRIPSSSALPTISQNPASMPTLSASVAPTIGGFRMGSSVLGSPMTSTSNTETTLVPQKISSPRSSSANRTLFDPRWRNEDQGTRPASGPSFPNLLPPVTTGGEQYRTFNLSSPTRLTNSRENPARASGNAIFGHTASRSLPYPNLSKLRVDHSSTSAPSSPLLPNPESRKRQLESSGDQRPSSRLRTEKEANVPVALPFPGKVAPLPPTHTLFSALSDNVGRIRQKQHLGPQAESRLTLLADACKREDTFCLYAHQILCLWSLQSPVLTQFEFSAQELRGIRMLDLLLHPNTDIQPKELIGLFATFPHTMQVLTSNQLATLASSVRRFFGTLAIEWPTLRNTCIARAYPPSPKELHTNLFLTSSVLQKSCFNSILHQIWPNAGILWRGDGAQIFTNCQNLYLARRARGQLNLEDVQESQAFGQAFMLLRAHINGNNSKVTSHGFSYMQHLLHGTSIGTRVSITAGHNQGFGTGSSPTQSPVLRNSGSCSLPAINGSSLPFPVLPKPGISVRTNPLQHAARFLSSMNNRSPTMITPQKIGTILHNAGLHVGGRPATVSPVVLAFNDSQNRSFRIRKVNASGNEVPDARYYQYIEKLALNPKLVENKAVPFEYKFDIPVTLFASKVRDLPPTEESPTKGTRLYANGSVLFRIRCVQTPVTRQSIDESQFSTLPTSWPEFCFVVINHGKELDPRRSSHHGRDFALDITHLLYVGVNSLKVSIRHKFDSSQRSYHLGVEVIRVADHVRVFNLATRLPAHISLASISRALKDNDDDDIVVVDPFVSVDLIDPFMATIWNMPARGRWCQHRECFDLEAFLQSRTSKQKGGPTNPDEWKCPICKKDARPQHLIIDEFLLGIRRELERTSRLKARAALVKKDGSWEAKVDESDDEDLGDMASPDGEIPGARIQNSLASPSSHELAGPSLSTVRAPNTIIVLDDD